jgi:nitric-oxide synthase
LTAFVRNLVDTYSSRPRSSGCPVTGHGAVQTVDATVSFGPVARDVPSPRHSPVPSEPSPSVRPANDPPAVSLPDAVEFLEQFYREVGAAVPFEQRLGQVRDEIAATGTYRHSRAELTFGARVAWRNSARCIGRLYWQSLRIRDRRHLGSPAEVAAECAWHLRDATRDGQIRSTLTVFAPDRPGRPGPRIHNEQLIRYAGYPDPDQGESGEHDPVLGDPRNVAFTNLARAMGWEADGGPGRFDVLPLVVTGAGHRAATGLFDLPRDAVLEVDLSHPEYPWFADLRLRWHAVPAISNMPLVIGGITYPAAPFNGWYLNTEVGARNLADVGRYNLIPQIAEQLGLDTSSTRTMWRDRALVELVHAVQHSFDEAGVRMADHHTESDRFLEHVAREKAAGRSCPTEWSWIVPPMSGGLTSVFHRLYDQPDPDLRPAFLPAK